MLPSSSWGKRKPRCRRLGWMRDARGNMWARQEGLHHPHPHPHAIIRCPSSSSSSVSSVSCSGKGRLGVLLLRRLDWLLLLLFCLLLPAVRGCHGPCSLRIAGAHLTGVSEPGRTTLRHPTRPPFLLRALVAVGLCLPWAEPSPSRLESLSHPAKPARFEGTSLHF